MMDAFKALAARTAVVRAPGAARSAFLLYVESKLAHWADLLQIKRRAEPLLFHPLGPTFTQRRQGDAMAAMNKVQFQAGMSSSLFSHRYDD